MHYLDDFLLVAPSHADLEKYSSLLTLVGKEVGLAIKTSKNEDRKVPSFAKVGLDC